MIKLLTAVTSALVFLAPLQVQAQTNPLIDFQGTWEGVGQTRTDLSGPFSPATCDIEITWIGNGIQMDGSCGLTGRASWSAGGTITGNGGALDGNFMTPYIVDVSNKVIEWRGNMIRSGVTITVEELILSFRIDITRPVVENGEYVMYMTATMSANGGPWTEAGNMRLIAQ